MIKKLGLWSLALLASTCVYAGQPIKVACIGNSVTAGYLLQDPEWESYPSVLQRMLGPDYEVGNFGHSGSTLLFKGHRPYVKTPEFQKALEYNADIYVIHLGLNDTDPRNWPHYASEFEHDYNTLIDSLTHRDPTKRVIIAQMSPITSGHRRFTTGTLQYFDEIQPVIKRIADKRRLELINLSDPLYNYAHLLPDAIHPTSEGAIRMARYVYGSLTGNWGGLSMSPYYGDGMVLQRGKKIRISGQADGGARVTVHVDKDREYLAMSNHLGRWSLLIDSLSTERSHSITIMSKGKRLQYNNVLAGDVWLASGQSNMAWKLSQTRDSGLDQAKSDDRLRAYVMRPIAETNKEAWPIDVLQKVNDHKYYVTSGWQTAQDPRDTRLWSAVAYHFGRTLRDSLPDVPIAIVSNPLGGAPIESFVSQRTLEHHLPDILTNWYDKPYSMPWVRERAQENIARRTKAQRHPYEPGYLFAEGIEPLHGLGFKGILWYQGESNADNAKLYNKLFPLLVEDLRHTLGTNLPIYTVQLPGISTRPEWSEFRLLQEDLSSTEVGGKNMQRGIYMIPSYDLADSLDVHPRNKYQVGYRLARLALQRSYQHADAYQQTKLGDLSLVRRGKKYYILSDGIFVKQNQAYDARPIVGFEVAGSDGVFFPVQIETDKKGRLFLSRSIGESLVAYRYAYAPYTRANLYNERGIPVLPAVGRISYYK